MLAGGIAGPLPEQADEYIRAILEAVARLSGQIENVLDLSQSEAGALPLAQKDVDVKKLLTGLATSRNDAIEHKKLDLDVQFDRGLGVVAGDEKEAGTGHRACSGQCDRLYAGRRTHPCSCQPQG